MNNRKILLVFIFSILISSAAMADYHYADSPEFEVNLLTTPPGGTWDCADSPQFGLDLSPIHRGWASSAAFFLDLTMPPGSNIEVSPEAYDFGDVELGSSSSTIITITNPLGGTYEDPLIIEDISFAAGSSGDFAITANPAGSTVQPGGSVDVGITFTPSAEGYVSTSLQIASDDPVNPLVEVALGGVGVFEELPPEGKVAAILSFVEASVEAGSLAGDGSGNSAGNRLNAFENMIEAAGDLIEDGLYQEACDQLGAAQMKCDGQPSPPDFVAGVAAEVVRGMIEMLRTTLGCQ